ncbi:hypothetical protein D3870_12165 [Noviherbaspirillum cavernae]|uniref:Uncharacterized protein n=2 Tax=Noviherbaspirillum cavernae TaxID=2320862 RepID=A0A418X2K4_9BURK|nr:hypothetical protein D3870_12165 [Noviherbaspirillum cavernae]
MPDPGAEDTDAGAASVIKNALSDNKGKLAIGVAATLGIMVFYKWREKQMAKDEPEDYARLQRLKAGVKTVDTQARQEEGEDGLTARLAARRNRKEKGAGVA